MSFAIRKFRPLILETDYFKTLEGSILGIFAHPQDSHHKVVACRVSHQKSLRDLA